MDTTQFLLLSIGGMATLVLLVLAMSGPGSSKQGAKRLQAVRSRLSENADDKVEAQIRRAVAARKPQAHQIAGSESRIAALSLRLHQSGTGWTLKQYGYGSLGLGSVVALLILIKTGFFPLALLVGVGAGAGLPHMVVNHLIKRRINNFTSKFPDAIELLVRGLRSGLPVTETLNVVSSEIPGPVGEEFKLVSERIRIGKSMDDALQDTADRLNMPEFNFFCITLAIQRETGGNLAETLANLADVLRKRAQMKLKIKAMSSESKASAYIVGALPFMVFMMIYWVNPQYLGGFFADQRLMIAGLGGLCWMGIGVFIMAQMVNFEI
ncbi:pilus assembly protein TadB [Novosphingobium sp. FSY-8]|uniref:Pilus assembly protein TadB n=1 Tax=Novosphingobium ovatum TaxID=1908523 RepID=A0ABW9XE56_9SPHN|nr:type II secretion system F family protein [Novosphingobium ovatum]NBC36795.1 pilus assembly protein TadB [Novosphingobium ovatum]